MIFTIKCKKEIMDTGSENFMNILIGCGDLHQGGWNGYDYTICRDKIYSASVNLYGDCIGY